MGQDTIPWLSTLLLGSGCLPKRAKGASPAGGLPGEPNSPTQNQEHATYLLLSTGAMIASQQAAMQTLGPQPTFSRLTST